MDRTASVLTHGLAEIKLPPYEFLSRDDLRLDAEAAAKSRENININIAGGTLKTAFLAREIRGRIAYAVASVFLWLASAAALGYGFRVVGNRVLRVVRDQHPLKEIAFKEIAFKEIAFVAFSCFGILACFAILAWMIKDPFAFHNLRPLVVEDILADVAKWPQSGDSLAIKDAEASFNNQFAQFIFRGFEESRDPLVTVLVQLNTLIGLTAVGMLLAALASVSILQREHATVRGLRQRREDIWRVLGLALLCL